MPKEEEQEQELEQEEERESATTYLPPSVFDRYHGHHVMVQLKREWIPVTYPGVPHAQLVKLRPDEPVPEKFDPNKSLESQNVARKAYSLPVIFGQCNLDKDGRGGVRVVIARPDPDESRSNMLIVSLHPDAIDSITLTTEESRIVEP